MSPRFGSRVALATATLLVLIAGHAVRETARDALFLADLPATSLPWAYLTIAAGALVLGAANRLLLDRLSHRRLLVATLALAVAVDVFFWKIASSPSAGALFGLYAWTGILGTAVTLQFWLHLANVFDVGEAKRAFPWVAAGGLLGAVLGAVLAGGLLLVIDTRSLLLASAGLLLLSACVALALPPRVAPAEPLEEASEGTPLTEALGSRYLVRITLLAVAVAMLATGIDFLFKHAVASSVPSEELGNFFAKFHAIVNAGALLFELVVASWLLRTLGVTRTLAVLPLVLLVSAGWFAAVGGFVTALLLKAVDGTLRPSLHQASTEVLYQPLSAQARNAAKTAAESLGKRGGQALASLAILGVASGAFDPRQFGFGLMALALLALLALLGLRGEYVARFRERLRGLAEEGRARIPPHLELHSLEALVSNLSSSDDADVLAAIELLERYDRTSLIPPLLLYHPSQRVVLRALAILRDGSHPHLDAILERLLEHPASEVRAAALNAVIARGAVNAPLERLLHSDPSPQVRTTAVVALVGRHEGSAAAGDFLAGLLERSSAEERLAVATALPQLSYAVASEVAGRIVADGDPAEAKALSLALAGHSELDPDWIPALVALLSRREARPAARAALLRQGERALRALEASLRDPDTAPRVCRHLPRTIHRFGGAEAAAILVRNLGHPGACVRYKVLRGLGRMRADDPDLEIPADVLVEQASRDLDRAVEMLAFRVAYAAWSRLHGEPAEGSEDLLAEVLADKEARTLERVFRALHIAEPTAEFEAVFEALRTHTPADRAGGVELIEHLVGEALRDGLLAMVGPASPAERLARAARSHGPEAARRLAEALANADEPPDDDERRALADAVEALCERMLADADPILVSIARHRLRGAAQAAAPDAGVRRRALR